MNDQKNQGPQLPKPAPGLSKAAPKIRGGTAPLKDVRIVPPSAVKIPKAKPETKAPASTNN